MLLSEDHDRIATMAKLVVPLEMLMSGFGIFIERRAAVRMKELSGYV